MLKRYRSAAIAVSALLITSGVLFAAGNWSTLPIVGGAAYCNSTVSGTGSLSGVTGTGQGTTGSICGSTTPAGPSAVTGTEVFLADLYRPDQAQASLGAQPQSALITLASLNALPIAYTTITTNPQTVAPSATSGGVMLHNNGGGTVMTAVTVDLPSAPIDGQQFAVSADAVVTTLTMTALNLPAGVTITNNPTVVTPSTTVAYGYRFRYSASANVWNRLQ